MIDVLVIRFRIHVPEPIAEMNVTLSYEKFVVKSTKCLQLWCVKHYCDFLTFVGFVEKQQKVNKS